MHEAVIQNTERRIRRTMEALRANNMEAYYVKTAAEVRPFVEQMIPEGAVVSNGGSVSLAETGVMDLPVSYTHLDVYKRQAWHGGCGICPSTSSFTARIPGV